MFPIPLYFSLGVYLFPLFMLSTRVHVFLPFIFFYEGYLFFILHIFLCFDCIDFIFSAIFSAFSHSGTDDGQDFPQEMLHGIFTRIQKNEFSTGGDHMTQLKQIEQSFIGKIPVRFSLNEIVFCATYTFFYKKLGSAPSTKSCLI